MPSKTARLSPHERLKAFLEGTDISPTAAGRHLGVAHTTVFSWISGDKTPSHEYRDAIEKWTKSAILASEWETPEERAIVERVTPYEPPAPEAA